MSHDPVYIPAVDYTKSRAERRRELREMTFEPKRINPPKRGPNRKMRRSGHFGDDIY